MDPTTQNPIGELVAALAKARAEFDEIRKDKRNNFGAYASLDAMISATAPALSAHGLAVVQTFDAEHDNGIQTLRTALRHTGGGWIDSEIRVPDEQNVQKLGAAITYLRRYSYAAILNVTADEDTDGGAGGGAGTTTGGRSGPGAQTRNGSSAAASVSGSKKALLSRMFKKLDEEFGEGGVWDKDGDEFTPTAKLKQAAMALIFADARYVEVRDNWSDDEVKSALMHLPNAIAGIKGGPAQGEVF